MKITAKLELTVVYDDGGYDDFDPDATLRYMVQNAADSGLLTPDDGPVVVDTYEVKVTTDEDKEPKEGRMKLFKTTIVVWSRDNLETAKMELADIGREATDGECYCSSMTCEEIADAEKDPDWDNTGFFDDMLGEPDRWTRCPKCKEMHGWNDENGLEGQECACCSYVFTGNEAPNGCSGPEDEHER